MKAPRPPRLEERRAPEFVAELEERAQAWIPAWGLTDAEHDFGRALLKIAARFNSEVAERFDGAGEKMRRGFLDWLGERGEAARPARMPVVFKLANTAREAVLASAPVRMQGDADGTPVVFETEKEVRVIPGRLEVVVGIDAEKDAFYLPAPGLNDLTPLEPLPTEWQTKSFASAGLTTLQLDPESGLLPEMIIEAAGQQYRVVKADKDLVTIEPPLTAALDKGATVTKVTTFAPFDGQSRNQQEHVLYLGDSELLNIEDAARIEVVGAKTLRTGVTWQYWGKVDKGDGDETVDWQDLPFALEQDEIDSVVLTKPKGAIDPREIDGKSSRWIRCITPTLNFSDEPFSVDALKLRINCLNGDAKCPPESAPGDDAGKDEPQASGPPAEGMANTTPLVLSEPFFPLGRIPRQFDAFYLGSTEAFSKKGAMAQLCFEMSDATCRSYTALRSGPLVNQILAGIGKDRALHLFKLDPANGTLTKSRGPLRPPFPVDGAGQADQSAPVSLNHSCRPVIWSGGPGQNDFFVAVAAGRAIWIWHESASQPKLSGWKLHSTVPAGTDPNAQVEDIIVLKTHLDPPGAVLSGGRFLVFKDSDSTWAEPNLPQPLRDYASLASIHHVFTAEPTDSMVAVSLDNEIFRLEPDGTETFIDSIDAPGTPVSKIRPYAVDAPLAPLLIVAVAVKPGGDELVGILQGSPTVRVSLGAGARVMGAEVSVYNFFFGLAFFVGSTNASGDPFVSMWVPFAPGNPIWVFQAPIPDASKSIDGTPLIVDPYIVVPGGRGDAFVAGIGMGNSRLFTKTIGEAVILPGTGIFGVGDFLSALFQGVGSPRLGWKITQAVPQHNGESLYVVDPSLGQSVTDDQNGPQLIAYRASDDHTGNIDSSTAFTPDPGSFTITPGMILRISAAASPNTIAFCEVDSLNGTQVVIKASSPPLPANTGTLTYWKPTPSKARVVPTIEFSDAFDLNWETLLRDYPNIYLDASPAAQPEPSPQKATPFATIGNPPQIAALEKRWTANPPALNLPIKGFLDGTIDNWRHFLVDTSSNPALSWEYWNGKGWGSLKILKDGTERLAATGTIKFKVPPDIAESDWAGKTNFWIRARLVGGDYGQEEVTVISTPVPSTGGTEQVIKRSTENIRAPLVLSLHLSYSICKALLPGYVLTKDSGTLRDQSDANRTPGAIVEAFVPLALTLGLLTQTSAASEPSKAAADCPPDCDCTTLHAGKAESTDAALTVAASATRVSGRELYIGLAATPSEGPVNVLLLVDERSHAQFAPLQIQALIADRFKPIVAGDATRALGESGVLSMSFPVPPTRAELFGKENLTWLRLKPGSNATDEWLPSLRGAYLNAAWASATETLTRELLGSSDGGPNLVVRLARPPVLRDTLELRVKEPLGEEEREALLKIDPNNVLSLVEGLPGDWVLWRQVTDPDDEAATERVYALDETKGEIRFGDGQHGKIPPTGRDSIVAFRYCRTEPGPRGEDKVPANNIAARTALNLVSPVQTVESVTAAEQAAGGAPPESDDRVLRFGFARQRHRRRAVTAYDLEDLTLQSSPDIAQARAFVRRGYVRLVVIMRGKNPLANAAQIRELRRLLLDVAPVFLSAPGALRIEQPRIRRLRISLKLRVESLDHTGELSTFVKEKLAEFFDTATGGVDQDGWALGLDPSENDIAFALSEAPHLESIEDVSLIEIADDGKEHPWEERPTRATEIVMLDEDPVRFHFATAEVMA